MARLRQRVIVALTKQNGQYHPKAAEASDPSAVATEESEDDVMKFLEGGLARDTLFEAVAVVATTAAKVQQRKRRNARTLVNTKSLRLNNNEISRINRLHNFIKPLVFDSGMITWLDFSYNKLTRVEPIVNACKHLKMLYLHVNAIHDPAQLDLLGHFEGEGLSCLTLHGNPLETALTGTTHNLRELTAVNTAVPNTNVYQVRVLAAVPTLRKLDFALLTQEQKSCAWLWKNAPANRRLCTPRSQILELLRKDQLDANDDSSNRGNRITASIPHPRQSVDNVASGTGRPEQRRPVTNRWHGHRLAAESLLPAPRNDNKQRGRPVSPNEVQSERIRLLEAGGAHSGTPYARTSSVYTYVCIDVHVCSKLHHQCSSVSP